MFVRYLALTIFLAQVSNGQQCGDQWRSHEQCMKNRRSNDADLSPSDRANMKAKARLCFRDQGCRDPFLDDGDSQAKQRCYVEYKDRMRRDIEHCVQQTYPDYDIPA
uniref:Uncharacterized protein n=1 Tax=Romanomermis culicivorax TaxID=13658 RepID=A0A915KIF6_ROMCU